MRRDQENAIKVRHLQTGYGKRVLMQDLCFEVRYGEIFGILGGSGCGKSTLLKYLIGLYPVIRGNVRILGYRLDGISDLRRRALSHRFGVTYQSGALFGSMTVGENIALVLEEFTRKNQEEIQQIVRKNLALVDLAGFENYFPHELSGGMIKRAAVARALALHPKLLFFDEPSAGLDPITSAGLDQLILKLRDELSSTIVIVTHELDSIFTVMDRVILLDKQTKGIIAEGSPQELQNDCTIPFVRDFLNRSGTRN